MTQFTKPAVFLIRDDPMQNNLARKWKARKLPVIKRHINTYFSLGQNTCTKALLSNFPPWSEWANCWTVCKRKNAINEGQTVLMYTAWLPKVKMANHADGKEPQGIGPWWLRSSKSSSLINDTEKMNVKIKHNSLHWIQIKHSTLLWHGPWYFLSMK